MALASQFTQEQPDSAGAGKYFDIDKELDFGPFSRLKLFTIFIVALIVILEAVAVNLLGLAIPKMMDDWHLLREAFKWTVTFSFIGMAVGAFFSGQIADRIGRRTVLLLSLPICGIATILIGATSSVDLLVVLRFFVGLGFGGVLPVAAATAAEFAPVRYRTMAVTVPIVCVALGTILAGFLFNIALPLAGWAAAFYIGGILALILFVLLLFCLPESPRFMAQHEEKWPALRLLLARLGSKVTDNDVFADKAKLKTEIAAAQKGGSNIAALFRNGLAGDTIAIWVCSFSGIFGLYLVYSWMPTILHIEGISEHEARNAMAYWFSFGGTLGALLCAWGCARFGTRITMISFAVGAVISVFALLCFDLKEHVLLMSVFIGLNGLFNNGIQVPLYAIFANLYPTRIRATGSSLASSVGKVGTILAGFVGALLSASGYFIFLGVFMILMLLALIVFKRHIPPVTGGSESKAG